jgi:spore maturation protein SpmA
MDSVDPSLTTSLFKNKVFEVGISIAGRFTDGIFVNARNIFMISLFLLGVGMFWESITRIANRIRILSPIK